MNISELAREAGPLISTPFDKWCEKFAALIREAVMQELTGVDMEPIGFWAGNPERDAQPCYTADQLAGAVAREREKAAKTVEAEAICDSAGYYAAAIRGQR